MLRIWSSTHLISFAPHHLLPSSCGIRLKNFLQSWKLGDMHKDVPWSLERWQWWDETELIYIHPLAHRPSATTLPQAVSPTIRDQQCWSTPQHRSWTDFCQNPNHLKRLKAKIRAPEQTHPLETHPKTLTLQYCDEPVFPCFAYLLLTQIKPCQKWPVTPHGDLNCLV